MSTVIMAIDSNDKKLALMDWDLVWEPGIVLDETAGFSQGDKQQLIWGYPGISWASAVVAAVGYYNIEKIYTILDHAGEFNGFNS